MLLLLLSSLLLLLSLSLLLLLQEDSKQTLETASFLASHYNPRLRSTHAPLPTPAPRKTKSSHTCK